MARVLVSVATSEFKRTLRSKARAGVYALALAMVNGHCNVYCRVGCGYGNNKNGKGKGQDTYYLLTTLPDTVSAAEWCGRKCKQSPTVIPTCWVEGRKIDKPLPAVPSELKGSFWGKVRNLFRKAA